MDLKQILDFVVKILFLGFGDKIKGYRTIIVNIGAILVGGYEWLTGSGLFSYLCESFNVACNAETSSFYGIVVIVFGVINSILRLVTEEAVPAMKKTT